MLMLVTKANFDMEVSMQSSIFLILLVVLCSNVNAQNTTIKRSFVKKTPITAKPTSRQGAAQKGVGFIDMKGNFVINCNKYEQCGDFHDGLAYVCYKGKFGYINKKGILSVACKYERVSDFYEGYASARLNGKWGVIDKTGNPITPFAYDVLSWESMDKNTFVDGYKKVTKDHLFGMINTNGEEVIPCKYDYISTFSNGLAQVSLNKKYGYIDKTGKVIIPIQYDEACEFRDGIAMCKRNGKYIAIDSKGETIKTFESIIDKAIFHSAHFILRKNGLYGCVDRCGTQKIPFIYKEICIVDPNTVIVRVADKISQSGWYSGIVDMEGRQIAPCVYTYIDNFKEGLAVAHKENKYGFIDTKGKEVIPCVYDYAYDFHEGLASVEKSGKYGFVNIYGKVVVDFSFDETESFNEGLAVVKKNGKFGVIDKTGKYVVPCKMPFAITNYTEGFLRVKYD